MKKIIATLALMGLLAVPVMSLAVGSSAAPTPVPGADITTMGDLVDKIELIGNWIFTGLLTLAGIFLLVAGFYFVTGGADPERLKNAKQMVINALIGVAIAVVSRGLITVIQNFLSPPTT